MSEFFKNLTLDAILPAAILLAIGILVISRTTGMTTDVDNYMFGSVLAMSPTDVALSVVLSIAVLVLFVLFYHKLFAVTFDESFSRATGLKVDRYNSLLAILPALSIVVGMRMMGAMLISSLVIFPALTAMRLFKSFRGVIVCAAITSAIRLVDATVNTVMGLCASVKVHEEDAAISFRLPGGLAPTAESTCQNLLTGLMVYLAELHDEYPDNIEVMEA